MDLDLIIGGLIGMALAYLARRLGGRNSDTINEIRRLSEEARDRTTQAAERNHAESVALIAETRRKLNRAKLAELSELINKELPDD